MPDAPSLFVNGLEYDRWESVKVNMDLEAIPDTFSMDASAPYLDIPAGAKCEIRIRGKVVLTGKLEKPHWHNGHDGRTFAVSGRSLPCEAVDNDAEPGTYLGQDLATLGDTLAGPYGVRVRCDFEAPIVPRLKVTPGQKVYPILEKLARAQALIWVCDANGDLVLDKPGRVKSGTSLSSSNCESMDTDLDMTKRYDSIECRGQVAGDDMTWGLDAHAVASVTDPSLKGKRRLILNAPNTATAQQCADRVAVEAAARLGKSAALTAIRSSWLQDDGTPWRPGLLVPAQNDFPRLETNLIVRSVALGFAAEGGTTCTMGLCLPQAYRWDRAIPLVERGGLRTLWPELQGNW